MCICFSIPHAHLLVNETIDISPKLAYTENNQYQGGEQKYAPLIRHPCFRPVYG